MESYIQGKGSSGFYGSAADYCHFQAWLAYLAMDSMLGRVAVVIGAIRSTMAGRSRKTLDVSAAATGNEALAIQAEVAKVDDLGKFYVEVSQKLGKIDLLFAQETLDVCAFDGFILEILLIAQKNRLLKASCR